MFKKHEIYIFVLSFLALSIKTYSTPFFVPCLATFMALVIYYALRFNLSELLWGITIVLLLVSLCLIVSPGENPNRVEWVNFGGESLKLSNGQNIRTSEDVKIGDIVDYNGKVILRGNRAVYFLPNMRLQIYNNVFRSIDYPISSLVAGCTLGVRRDIPQSIRTYFVLSGCYHYLAISGLHVGIFIALLSFTLKILRFKKPLSMASILTSPAIPLTGMPPSAVRAYLFSLLSSLGYENYRNVSPLYITGLILLISILLCKLSIGMVLSFLAVCGIILTYDEKDSWLKKLTTISISPFLFTLPAVLYRFGTFNLLSPINSLLLMPLFSVSLASSFLCQITLFKISTLNKVSEWLGYIVLRFNQLLFTSTKSFVFHKVISQDILFATYLLMLLTILAGRRKLPLVLPMILIVYTMFTSSKIANKTINIDGQYLNSSYFLTQHGLDYENCTIRSNYVFPYAKKILYKNRIIEKQIPAKE